MGEAHNREFRIRFMPKSKEFSARGGYMVVSDNVWRCARFVFPAFRMLRFNNLVEEWDRGSANEFCLCISMSMPHFRLLGNVIDSSYTAVTRL